MAPDGPSFASPSSSSSPAGPFVSHPPPSHHQREPSSHLRARPSSDAAGKRVALDEPRGPNRRVRSAYVGSPGSSPYTVYQAQQQYVAARRTSASDALSHTASGASSSLLPPLALPQGQTRRRHSEDPLGLGLATENDFSGRYGAGVAQDDTSEELGDVNATLGGRRPSWVSIQLPTLTLPSSSSSSADTVADKNMSFSDSLSSHQSLELSFQGGRRRGSLTSEPDDDLAGPSLADPCSSSLSVVLPSMGAFPQTSPFTSTDASRSSSPPTSIAIPSSFEIKLRTINDASTSSFVGGAMPPASFSGSTTPFTTSPVSGSPVITTAGSHARSLSSPTSPAPIIPARSPLRPRYSGTPSISSVTSLLGDGPSASRPSSVRSNSITSNSSVRTKDDNGIAAPSLEATLRRPKPPNDASSRPTSSATAVPSLSSAREASCLSLAPEVMERANRAFYVADETAIWLDGDDGSEEETAAGFAHASGSAGPRPRPPSTTGGILSERAKAKWREARITSTYFEALEGESEIPPTEAEVTLADGASPETAPFDRPTHSRSHTAPSPSKLQAQAAADAAATRSSTRTALPPPIMLPRSHGSASTTISRSGAVYAAPLSPPVLSPTPSSSRPQTIQRLMSSSSSISTATSSNAHGRSNSQPFPFAAAALNKPLPSPSAAAAAAGVGATTPTLSKRGNILHEIHTTERSYARDLATVRDAYLARFGQGMTMTPTELRRSASRASTHHSQPRTPMELAMGDRRTLKQATAPPALGDHLSNSRLSGHSIGGSGSGALNGSGLSMSSALPITGASGFDSPQRSPSISSPSSPYAGTSSNGGTSSYFSQQRLSTLSSTTLSSSPTSTSQGAGSLSLGDTRAVFLNIEAVAALAGEFASVLERMALEQEGKDMIGEAFLAMMPRIKQAYTWYCSRQAAAHTKLVQLLTDARHATYFAESWELARPHTNAWDLPSLLIKPVQRVLKYPLLLDDLLRCTPETHPDHGNIQDAATAIKAVADEINEVKRRKETVDRVFQPAGSLSDPTSPAPNSHHHPASTTSSKGGKMASKLGGLLGKDRDKDKDRDFRAANAAASQAALQFNQKSHDELRATEKSYAALVTRLMAAEQTARQLGKLVAGAGTRAREPWAAQRRAVEVWRRIVNLDGLEPVEDIRIEAYRSVVLEILARPCKAMEDELRDFILPALLNLVAICKGPRAVVLQRNAKYEDYNRVVLAKFRGDFARLARETDAVDGAQTFVALHHQLLLELPPLLDGFSAVLGHIVRALAALQAKFHGEVRALLGQFWVEYPPVVMDTEDEEGEEEGGREDNAERGHAREAAQREMMAAELEKPMDTQSIIRVWQEASAVPAQMLDLISITQKLPFGMLDMASQPSSRNGFGTPSGASAPAVGGGGASSTMLSRTPSVISTGGRRRSEHRTSTPPSSSTSSLFPAPASGENTRTRSRASSSAGTATTTTKPFAVANVSSFTGGSPVSPFHPSSESADSPSPSATSSSRPSMFQFRRSSRSKAAASASGFSPDIPASGEAPLPKTPPSRSAVQLPIPLGVPIPVNRTTTMTTTTRSRSSTASSLGPVLSALSFEGSDGGPQGSFADSVIRRLSLTGGAGGSGSTGGGSAATSVSAHTTVSSDGGGSGGKRLSLMSIASSALYDPRSPSSFDRSFGAASPRGSGFDIAEGVDTTPTKRLERFVRQDGEDDLVLGGDTSHPLSTEETAADEPATLYRCECVADFDLGTHELTYMSHQFLKISRGDEIDVVYEVGRVDELDDFPLDVGLEDDGLLIGRNAVGLQGFVLCSFLQPLDAS